MQITCWGSRGSIPVSGDEYNRYGGDTTCLEIRSDNNDVIIIDAGTGIRKLGLKLKKEKHDQFHFIFTHAHWDHLMGFPFFEPLYKKETCITVYRCPFPSRYAEQMITRVMTPPNFPIRYSDLKAKIQYKDGCPGKFTIGSVTVESIPLSHPNGGCGYKFTENGKTFIFLTDNELGFLHTGGLPRKAYAAFSKDADLLIHDAEYTPDEYQSSIEWGHSTYTDVMDLAIAANVKQLGLFHLNQCRTDNDMDRIVGLCRHTFKELGVKTEVFGVAAGMTFQL